MPHVITVFHVYQDIHNPTQQRIILSNEYSVRYALFKALIDSGKDFNIEWENEIQGEITV